MARTVQLLARGFDLGLGGSEVSLMMRLLSLGSNRGEEPSGAGFREQ